MPGPLAAAPASQASEASLAPRALEQIETLLAEKRSWTPIQLKLESQLIHVSKLNRGQPFAPGLTRLDPDVSISTDGRVLVDITANVTPALLKLIELRGGQVINSFPQFEAIRAWVPVHQLEALAANADVKFIRRAVQAATSVGAFDSEGDTTHRAALARTTFGVNGSGVKIGVLSDTLDFLTNSQSSGDLPTVAVLPGQGGPSPRAGEGTAMLEIIHDLAPGAQLFFATALNGPASFAQNILNLRSNGCDIIVDDVTYFNESPFQDGVVAQAVNTVTTNGAWFFSAAGNAGNLNSGASGTWEGDYVDGGPVSAPITNSGRIHSFGPLTYNTVVNGGTERHVDLFWTDGLGVSGNDYDVFVLDAAGSNVLRSSITRQTGTQDPYEFISSLNAGERIVIVKFAGAPRFLHLGTGRGRLNIATSGAITGHAAATNAFCVAAVGSGAAFPYPFSGGNANPVQAFSSDGPRRVFYNANGSQITPGNFLSTGGAVRQKPDLAAADGVTTSVPGFAPFFGTSASAPHAAAIAALLRSANPGLTASGLRTILSATALDVGTPGPDQDSGAGIVMAEDALEAAADNLWINPGEGFLSSGPVGGPFVPNSVTFTLTNGGSNSISWTLVNTSAWLNFSASSGTLAAAGTNQSVIASLASSATNLAAGIYQADAWFTNLTTLATRRRPFTLLVGQPDYFTERFELTNNLSFQSFTFTTNGSSGFYGVCRQVTSGFYIDPAGGTALNIGDDDFVQVTLSGTNTVSLYGHRTNSFFIGSNGYLTFEEGDTQFGESLANHFNLPRISALFDDLSPEGTNHISWKQLADRVVVTYLAIPEFDNPTQTNSFQIELFFNDRIRITFLTVTAPDGLVGLSAGEGVPAFFQESHFSSYNICSLPLMVVLPASATEGDETLVNAGEIRIPEPVGTNLIASLTSLDVSEVTVPGNLLIPAGQTNASFNLTIVDDLILDGTQQAKIVATAPSFTAGTNTISILDNETTVLSLDFTNEVAESAGVITGKVFASAAPSEDLNVALFSSNTNELLVPPSVVISAGTTSAIVTATVLDDNRIDGDQIVTLSAQVPNWTNGQAATLIRDNENTNLTMLAPSSAREGHGVLPGAGRVVISGTLPTNLVVTLQSLDTTEVILPATVTILTGQTSTVFNVTVVDDTDLDGSQPTTLTASAPGFAIGVALVTIADDEMPFAAVNPQPPHQAANVDLNADLAWSYPPGEGEQLLGNRDFETGTFTPWVVVPSAAGAFLINSGTVDPPSPDGPSAPLSGGFSALAQESGPGIFSMYQDVTISSNASVVVLSWIDRIRNFGTQFSTNQQFRVEVRDTNDTVLAVVFTTNPSDPLLGSVVQRVVDLSNYKGQTIRVAFVVNPGLNYLDVHLDNIALRAGTPPSTSYDVYFGTNTTPVNLLGTTTNTAWTLPTLLPLTTYYWQIVARRTGQATGPIWSFTTSPAITISDVLVVEGETGLANALFNVSLVPASAQTVSVAYATANITALAGSDYLATNGVLVFNPGETNHAVLVRVIGDHPYEANETFAVNLSLPNVASITDTQAIGTILNDDPLLETFANQQIPEGTLLSVTASNNAGPGYLFSLEPGAPSGAAIHPVTGLFTWTPSEAQGPGDFTIGVRLASTNSPDSETKTFMVHVTEVNEPPSLTPIVDRIIHVGATLVITNSASDPDIPTNTLTFSLDPIVPAGAVITNGVFRWTPTELQLGTNAFVVRVTDNGSPVLSDTNTFHVVVVSRPLIESIVLSSSNVTVKWTAVPSATYQLQYKHDPGDSAWSNLPATVTASGTTAEQSEPLSTRQRFYRVMLVP